MGSIIDNGLTTGLSILQGESGPEGDTGEPGPDGPRASNLKFFYLYILTSLQALCFHEKLLPFFTP